MRDWLRSQQPGVQSEARWERQSWLLPHWVVVVHVPGLRCYRLVVTKKPAETAAGSGEIVVDVVRVPNHFAAMVVKYAVLDALARWRVELPPGRLQAGGTEVWRQSGPSVALDGFYVFLTRDVDGWIT